MNIWYFNHYAGGPGIGPAMRSYYLARHWASMGHETTIFVARFHHLLTSGQPLPAEQMIDGVRYLSLPARKYSENGVSRFLNMLDYCRAMQSVQEAKPDAIIVSSPHPFAIYPARKLAQKYGAKLAFEVRDLWPLSITEIAGKSKLHPIVMLAGFAQSYAYEHADVVASLLEHAEPYMASKGLTPGKFIYAPNGIDLSGPQPTRPVTETGRAAAKQIEDWQREGRKVLIHPGSQGIPNALDKVIDAVALLKSDPRLGLLLVGSGGETERLKEQASNAELSNVAFFPRVPKEEALWLTAASDIGYAGGKNYPTLYKYGTSFNKVTDFIRFGVPFVEVIKTGLGILAESDDPQSIAQTLRQVLDEDPEKLRADAKTTGAVALKKLDYETIARRYLEALSR
ncbi:MULTISPECIES: glycosyltransferase family 4 protein [Mesorhizobium]|uniref:Glycosyltransferase WbuB n=1 Tax=Mesorhizobium denitrificans TaxID=2294114 RepID=A0A371XFT4_9HYPH|nr:MULTISPECIES: glycosyltransferase family 4 protein [Mesorhizobium]RFC67894.1 glycosyltransferase WbuB [Mesorhizobium denitrificans]